MKEKRNDYDLILKQQLFFLESSCRNYDLKPEYEMEAIRIAGHLRTLLNDKEKNISEDDKIIKMLGELEDKYKKIFSSELSYDINQIKKKRRSQIELRKNSVSLFNQMGIKNILYVDTSHSDEEASISHLTGNISDTIVLSENISYYGLVFKECSDFKQRQTGGYLPKFQITNIPQEQKSVSFDEWWNEKIIFNNRNGVIFNRKQLVLNVCNLDGYAHIDENLNQKYIEFKTSNFIEKSFINDKEKNLLNSPAFASIRQIAFEIIESLKKANIYKQDNNFELK